jgi:hypothetical protein
MRCYCVLLNGHLVGIHVYSSAADANTIYKRILGSTVESCRLNCEVVANDTGAVVESCDREQSSVTIPVEKLHKVTPKSRALKWATLRNLFCNGRVTYGLCEGSCTYVYAGTTCLSTLMATYPLLLLAITSSKMGSLPTK